MEFQPKIAENGMEKIYVVENQGYNKCAERATLICELFQRARVLVPFLYLRRKCEAESFEGLAHRFVIILESCLL